MGSETSKPLPAPDKQDKGIWYWQSNKNPWSKEESQEWTAYSNTMNNIIEQAYHQKKESVDIDGYHLHFVKKLQVSKQDKDKQRRIKRVVNPEMISTLERGDRYCENLPISPSVNNPYGDVENFLNFFSSKFPNCEYFLHDLGATGFIRGRDTLEGSFLSENKTEKDRKDGIKLLKIFYSKFQEIEVLEAGLRAYTEETFLYRRVNELLRNEDWKQMEGLSPYVLVLLRSFTLGKFSPQYSGADGKGPMILVLYRGCHLTKDNIAAYDSKLHGYFSWNAVTSTTKNKLMAERFISKPPPDKVATLFVIEAEVYSDPKKNINMIDISPHSAFPSEDEVIFAPGTNFEVVSSSRMQDNRHEIKLRVINSDELRQNGVELVGDFHKRIFPCQESSQLVSLNENEIERAVELLRGNSASNRLKIDSCKLGSQSMSKICQALMTTQKIDSLIIKNTLISLESAEAMAGLWKISSLTLTPKGTINKESAGVISKRLSSSVKRLTCKGHYQEKLDDEFLLGMITGLPSTSLKELYIKSFNLNIQIIVELINALPGCIDHVFFIKNKLSSIVLYSLLYNASKASVPQVELDSNLYFDAMGQDNEIQVNTEAKLNRVTLRFDKYSADTSPRGMRSLFSVLSKFTTRTLEFVPCSTNSSNTELDNEMNQLLTDISTISSIENIEFTSSPKGIENALKHFRASPQLQRVIFTNKKVHYNLLSHSQNLFIEGSAVDQAWKNASEFIQSFSTLEYVFLRIFKITDEGADSLLTSLGLACGIKDLSVDMSSCPNITDKTLTICWRIVTSLKQLDKLRLNFRKTAITLSDDLLQKIINDTEVLPALKELQLDISECQCESASHLFKFCSGLTRFVNLESFTLSSLAGYKVSDGDVLCLGRILRSMKKLMNLRIDFRECILSNEHLHILGSELAQLSSLGSLALNLRTQKNITDQGITFLSSLSHSSVRLKALSLHIYSCYFSDQGFNDLAKSLKGLKSLTYLKLILFFEKNKIECLTNLADAICSLPNLETLDIYWHYMPNDDGVKEQLRKSIKYVNFSNAYPENY